MTQPYPTLCQKLRVVVLATDEEDDLPACLDAVPPGIAVTVLQSSESRDRTVEIARSRGAQVLTNPWDGFAAQRDFATHRAGIAEAWILFIDADEIFTAAFWTWCEGQLAGDPAFDGAFISSHLILDGVELKHAPAYPVYHARLVRTGVAHYVRNMTGHGETLAEGTRTTFVDIPYMHYIHSGPLKPWMEKHLRLAERDLESADANKGGLTTARARLNRFLPNGPWRAILRFFYHYLWCLGFLDGQAGLRYSAMYAWYEMSKWVMSVEGKKVMHLGEQAPASARLRTPPGATTSG